VEAAVVEVEFPEVPVPVVPVPVVPVPVVPVPVLSEPVVPVPVLEAAVVTPDLVAEAKTLLAAAEPVVVPRVLLFVPLPRGTLSLRSGTLKVVDPSPTP
jgi:signal-induced proliferation-associated 1 like protein 3